MPAFFLAVASDHDLLLLWTGMATSDGTFISKTLYSSGHCNTASSTTAALMRNDQNYDVRGYPSGLYPYSKGKRCITKKSYLWSCSSSMHCFLLLLLLGTNFGFALGGSIVLEQVFTIPGLGQLMINAIRQKDTPIVMGAVMTTAILPV